MSLSCTICTHSEAMHDRWGICGVPTCEPCYKKLACPRCEHTFFEHSISDSNVHCSVPACRYVTCYLTTDPGNPVRQPTYEESLPHPLTPRRVTDIVVVEDEDPEIAPGIWKKYKPGRSYDTAKGGYVLIDLNEKLPNGAYKHPKEGRMWEQKLHGYIDIVEPGPAECGFVD